ncbi:MAG TPA: hypothetical protein ENK57_08045, partial [Polyangiaceae bacterium]|nr:hypothetical protein [Polyangiaceae bacterium]
MTSKTLRLNRLLALTGALAGLVLATARCGDDETGTTGGPAPTAAPATATASASASAPAPNATAASDGGADGAGGSAEGGSSADGEGGQAPDTAPVVSGTAPPPP